MKCKPYCEITVEIRTQLKTVKITSNIFAVYKRAMLLKIALSFFCTQSEIVQDLYLPDLLNLFALPESLTSCTFWTSQPHCKIQSATLGSSLGLLESNIKINSNQLLQWELEGNNATATKTLIGVRWNDSLLSVSMIRSFNDFGFFRENWRKTLSLHGFLSPFSSTPSL